jgi:hypothetical protein
MDTRFINPQLSKSGPWIVTTPSGAFAMCDTGLSALRAAYVRSGEAPSFLDAPNGLVRVGTDERLTAEEVFAEWRNLGWPLPT